MKKPLLSVVGAILITSACHGFPYRTQQTPGVIPIGIQNPPPPPPPPDGGAPGRTIDLRSISVAVRVNPKDPGTPPKAHHVHLFAYLIGADGKERLVGHRPVQNITYYGKTDNPDVPAGWYTETAKFNTELPGLWKIVAVGQTTGYQPVFATQEFPNPK